MNYSINKGIGKPAEFKGLTTQYLFLFAGGLLGVFVVFVILYMAGVPQTVCIVFGAIAAGTLIWASFHLNGKYGEHGLMKQQAAANHPRCIINRRQIPCLFRHIRKKGGPV
jgi:hypothetical protein